MSTLNIPLLSRRSKKKIPKLSASASWPGVMINPQWLKLPIYQINFHGPKYVWTIIIWLYCTIANNSKWTAKAISENIDLQAGLAFTVHKCPKDTLLHLGPVVQSVVSLTSSLRVISLTILADSIYNILIFFADKMWVAFALQKLLTFFQQKISAYLRITQCKF